jgi:hypothetical protein
MSTTVNTAVLKIPKFKIDNLTMTIDNAGVTDGNEKEGRASPTFLVFSFALV